MSYNKVIMMGRLCRDPEVRTIPSGTPVAEFSIAVDSGFGDNKKTCFVDVVVWGKQAEFVEKYFKKGAGIHLEGRLDLDVWEKDGAKRQKHKVTAERVTFPVGGSSNNENKDSSEAMKKLAKTFGGGVESIEDVPF